MAGYTVRSLAQLAAEAKSAFVQAVQGTATKLWPNVWRVEAKVLSLLGFEMEQRRAWLVRQLFASTADRVWLIRHGFELGLQPDPASSSIGTATAAAAPNTVVPVGLQYARGDGATYTTLASATATGNSVGLTLEADVAGAAGDTPPGSVLTLVNPNDAPTGLATTCTVDGASDGTGLSGGADAEETETFRARVLYRKRNPPQGGAGADYVKWVGEAVPTARQVFVDSYANDERAVWVQFTVTDQPNGIPTAGQVAAAQAYIDETYNGASLRRPVTARVFVTRPIGQPVDLVIRKLYPDTVDIRDAIEAEVAATFVERANPGTPSTPFTFSASWLDEAISRVTGEDSHDVDSPDDIVFTAGNMPVLGTIEYVS